tara:strand:- start:62 stop:388 length:327 start_codon:yes stop_codon:yes gene_type:complete
MKLLTDEIKAALPPLYTTEGLDASERKIICKFFNPVGAATWYICEGHKQPDGDWLMFGLCDLGLGEPEWGYVTLNELESLTLPLGLGIERDIFFSINTPCSEVMEFVI